jgi:type VI secretion system secreted protein VgrG
LTGLSKYVLFVVPPLWFTTRRHDHRIFQNISADDICLQVIQGYAERIAKPALVIASGKPKSEYRVQYGETDHRFLFRVLAEEGIASYFDHATGSAWTLIDDVRHNFGDSKTAQFVPPTGTGMSVTRPQVSGIAITTTIDTSNVTVRDWDFKKTSYLLEQKAATTQRTYVREASLEHYEFLSGKFTAATEKQGQVLAQQFLEEARSERRVLECTTNFALGAGDSFTVQGHPRDDVNGELRVIRSRSRVWEEGDKLERECVLVCVPGNDPWRPTRIEKPRIFGTHLALVVGNKIGVDEIDVDEFGRVKVEFRWDRRDQWEGNPTRFVRVSQGWAGLDYGFVMLPRVGEEVIVAYLDGDPDEPVIVGRLHNAFNRSPLNLPDEKTKSIWRSKTSPGGGGHNEIMMEDKQGQELLELHAHRDNVITVNGTQSNDVGGDQINHVKRKRKDHVEGLVDETYDTSLKTIIAGPQTTHATNVEERYKTQNTETAGTKHQKAGATDERFASWDVIVEGVHHEGYGTMNLNGGAMNWTDVGSLTWNTGILKWTLPTGTITADSFVINAPQFKVANAGSHTEAKGDWFSTCGKKGEAGVFKSASNAIAQSHIGLELKVYGASINFGSFKLDAMGIKVASQGAFLESKGIDLSKKGLSLAQIGARLGTFGFYSIS